MDEFKQFTDFISERKNRRRTGVTRLGEAATRLLESQILPRQARFGAVVEAWDSLLPAELRRHCKLAEVSAGQLTVLVDSPSYVYELRLCSSELLEQLQQQCPRARIKKIRITVG